MADEKPKSNEISQSVFTLNEFSSKIQLTETTEIESEYYNPFDHRDQVKGGTTSGSLAHLLKSSLGTGILAMPMAFKNAGLLFGMIGTLVVGFMCTHCVRILVQTSHGICKDIRVPALGFAETAEKVFENGPKKLKPWANFARLFIDVALMGTYFGATCVYIVFIASSFHNVINSEFHLNWDIRIYIALTVVPCLLIGQIRNLKYLVPFSAIANVFIVVTFGITAYFMFKEPLVFSDKPLFSSWSQLPLFFATVVFAMEGIGVVMPVENSMKKPHHFLACPGVLNTAMTTVVLLYATVGFLGYVKYGDAALGSVTLNLQEGSWLADAAKLLMAVAVLFTFGLQFYVPIDILWKKFGHTFSEKNQNTAQILLRTGVILLTGVCAAAIPNLEPFIGLVGAVFLSLLGFFIPSVMQTVYLWPDRLGRWNWILAKNIVLVILAILALVAGTTVSIQNIMQIYT